MKNKETQHYDQAQYLRNMVHDNSISQMEHVKEQPSLPPRSEVHKKKKAKIKWKIKHPIVRLLAIFFILLPIIILSIYYKNNGVNHVIVPDSNSHGVTEVEVESP